LLDQQLETIEDFVKERENQIIQIHQNITLVSQINEEISILITQQSSDIDKVQTNVEKSIDKLK
jgi:ACT domain-containing protein